MARSFGDVGQAEDEPQGAGYAQETAAIGTGEPAEE